MTYRLTLLTEADRDLVVEALTAEADKRTRVARGVAQHVATDKAAGKDVRSASVRVAMLLAESGTLADLARELANAADVPVYTMPGPPVVLVGPEAVTGLGEDPKPIDPTTGLLLTPDSDDGLSPAAHAAADLAGLDDALLDPDGEDVDTGATAEDDPTPDTIEEALPHE